MNKLDKKGFTLVELIAVVVILIVLMTVAVAMANKQMEKSRVNAFLKEANTFAKGALQKESVDRTEDLSIDDIFHNVYPGKVCYSVTQNILDKYVSKPNNKYYGSVEVCYGLDCTYQTKLWISDGKHFIDGVSDPKSEADISTSFTSTQYPESCGVKAIGGGTKGNLTTAEFDYTGGEQVMEINIPGVYALEVWGAQGGAYLPYQGGYGGYTYVEVQLNKGNTLYVNVGEQGHNPCTANDDTCIGSYGGGGRPGRYAAGGGGGTTIATKSGLLYTGVQPNYVLAAAGGGGGAYSGNNGKPGGGRCTAGWNNAFNEVCVDGSSKVYGGYAPTDTVHTANGGGYYSSSREHSFTDSDFNWGVWGGFGYFTARSKNGVMYTGSNFGNTETSVYTTNFSDEPIPQYAKLENGYARITYIENFTESE